MATYDLKRFARAHILKAIAPKNLVSFLLPYREYFQQRGFDLSLIREEMKSEDFNVLLRVLIDPDLDTPQRLIDALYHVNEMATQEGMEVLLAAYEEAGYSFEDSDPTPADLAVQAWMMDGRLFETTCANQYKLKPRAYRVYQSVNGGNGSMRSDGEALVAFEHDLNDWFERLDGGYGLRVTYDSEDIFDDPRFLRLTPPDALVTEAVLSVKYVGEGRARSTEIRIPNIVECRRDGDGVVLDRWLRERGFIRDHGSKPEVLSDDEAREAVAHS